MAQLKSSFHVKQTARSQSGNYDWETWLNGTPQALVRGVDFVATDESTIEDVERNLVSMFKINAKKKGLKPIVGEFKNGKQSGDDEFIDQPKKGKESEYATFDGIILFAEGPADEMKGKVYTLQQNARSAAWAACKKAYPNKKYKDMNANEKKEREQLFDESRREYIMNSSYDDTVKTKAMLNGDEE